VLNQLRDNTFCVKFDTSVLRVRFKKKTVISPEHAKNIVFMDPSQIGHTDETFIIWSNY